MFKSTGSVDINVDKNCLGCFRSTGNTAINVDKNFRSVFKVDKESGELKFRKFPIFTNVMKVPNIHKCYECSVLKARAIRLTHNGRLVRSTKLNKVGDKINLVLFFPKC